MKKLLALAVVLAVLMAAGCLGESSDNKNDGQTNCTWELPHAKVIHLTNGTVYAVDVYSPFRGQVIGLTLVYLHNDTVYTYHLPIDNCGSRVIVENNTIKVLEG